MLKRALAILDEHANSIPCVVRDLSETGAKLVFEEFSPVPPRFELLIELDGLRVECERIWYDAGVCGVRFVGEKQAAKKIRAQVVNETRFGMADVEDVPRAHVEQPSTYARPADIRSPAPIANRPVSRPNRAFGKRS